MFVSSLLQAAKVGAQAQLVRDCRTLLKRLTAEVEISKAITCFPTVRLPIDVRAASFQAFLTTSVLCAIGVAWLRAQAERWERRSVLVSGAYLCGSCKVCAVLAALFLKGRSWSIR